MKKRFFYYLFLIITTLITFNFIISYAKPPSVKREFSKKNVYFSQTSINKLNSTMTPVKSLEIVGLPSKWEQYSDFEKLQKSKKIEVFAPSDLPQGFILQKTEYQHETIKGTYSNGKQALIFIQTTVSNDQAEKEASWKDNENETTLSWSTTKKNFEIKSENLNKEVLNSFKQSLRSISNATGFINLPFEIISCTELSEKNSPKNRTFSLFSVKTFREFAKKQSIIIDKRWQEIDGEIIIGLFAGEKGSSGYTITTSQVTFQDNQLTIKFYESEPIPDMNYLTVITYPFQFIAIKIPSEKEVSTVQFVTEKGEAIAKLVVKP